MSPLWRNRDFMLLWSAQSISALGSRIGGQALALTAVLTLGAGPFQLSVLSAAQAAPALALGFFAGAWLDRRRRRPVMIVADFARAAALLTIPLAAVLGILSLGQLYIVALLAASLGFLFEVAYESLLPHVVARSALIEATGKRSATSSAAEVVGPSLGGVLVQALTAPFAILLDALSFIVSGWLLLKLRPEQDLAAPETHGRSTYLRDIRDGLRSLWRHDVLRPLIAAKALRSLFGGIVDAFYVFYVVKALGISPALMGVIVGCGGVASLLGAWVAPILAKRFAIGPMLIVAQIFILLGVGCLPLAALLPAALIPVMLVAHQIVADLSLTFYVVMERSLRLHLAPPELLGRINSTWLMLAIGPGLLGALLGGAVAEGFGVDVALWVAVGGYVLSLFIVSGSKARSLTSI
jgi:predicted MFS family arabinose efflux permease